MIIQQKQGNSYDILVLIFNEVFVSKALRRRSLNSGDVTSKELTALNAKLYLLYIIYLLYNRDVRANVDVYQKIKIIKGY